MTATQRLWVMLWVVPAVGSSCTDQVGPAPQLSEAEGTGGCTSCEADCGGCSDPSYNWFPGYYALSNHRTTSGRERFLENSLVAPFDGVQFRYRWAESELSPGDYTAGFEMLDIDLARAAAAGKPLLVMLMYKEFNGTSAVPPDLRSGPGDHCSGRFCGELVSGETSLAMLWNAVVEERLRAWLTSMARHLAASEYHYNVAGIVFNETSLPTKDRTILAEAGFDPYLYLEAVESNMLATTAAAERLITFLYYEHGFRSMDGEYVGAGERLGDFMLKHPRTGVGMSNLVPKEPDDSDPCAMSQYQGRIPCNPLLGRSDYGLDRTDSIEQSFAFGLTPAPTGLSASYLSFSYNVGSGPNAFTFEDVSVYIQTHPMPNTAAPTW